MSLFPERSKESANSMNELWTADIALEWRISGIQSKIHFEIGLTFMDSKSSIIGRFVAPIDESTAIRWYCLPVRRSVSKILGALYNAKFLSKKAYLSLKGRGRDLSICYPYFVLQ